MRDPKLLQLLYAKLEQETARAEAEKQAKEAALQNRDEYKAISEKERERADLLEKANSDRREESAQLRASVGFLRQSVDEYKVQREDDKREIEKLRGRQKYYLVGGAVLGAAACSAIRP